jgi:flagellin-like hook-associated protein FlgL
MSVTAIGSQNTLSIQRLIEMRAQLDDLSRQLSTGQKSTTYAGLGTGSGLSVSLNAQLSALSSFDNNIDMVSTRINVMTTALDSMSDITNTMKSTIAAATSAANSTGPGSVGDTAQASLAQLVDLLNSQAGNRYLFSGTATDQPAVASMNTILDGDGARAGLKQVIDERNQADLGADGLGRLSISTPPPPPGSVTIAEDSSPFGFKLASATSNLTNGSVTGPTGSPAGLSIDFTGAPQDGDTIKLGFTLPDGSTTSLTLTATTDSPPGPDQFTIGTDAATTATNFNSALTTAIGTLGSTDLTAASAVAASNNFFDDPPQRVSGSPLTAATALTNGTAANTVSWYTGEPGSGSARSTATSQVDPSLTVSYGARANEDGIRNLVQNVATLAAVNIDPTDANANDLSAALNQRVNTNLSNVGGGQTVEDISTDLANAQVLANNAKGRHTQTNATLSNYQQQITGVSTDQVGAELLTLQTRMQASMQTTAMLLQTSLVNYLPTG